jgi:hypothetical protein
MTDAEKLSRAADARALLDAPLLKEALAAVGAGAHRMFEAAKTPEELQRARDFLESGNRFILYLRSIISQGDAITRRTEPSVMKGRAPRPWDRKLPDVA